MTFAATIDLTDNFIVGDSVDIAYGQDGTGSISHGTGDGRLGVRHGGQTQYESQQQHNPV